MVDRVIRVIVDPSRARTGLQSINRETKGVTSSLGGLRTGLVGVIGALGVRELVRYADTWTLLNNRLRLVTESSIEQAVIMEELIDLSRETRNGMEPTVELFSRLARSTEDLGLTQREVLGITKSVNQAIQISGSSAAEASAAVIQFSQGLASGALRGDELRSVLEQTPRLARALADGLNAPIGQLRVLGAQGKLTAKAVTDALQDQAGVLEAEFAQTEATVEQGLTAVSDSFLIIIGRIDDATGSTAAFASLLQATSEIITDDLGPSLISAFSDFSDFIELTFGRIALVIASIDEFGERGALAIAEAREEAGLLDDVMLDIANRSEAANKAIQALPNGARQITRLITSPFLVLGDAIRAVEDDTKSVPGAMEELADSIGGVNSAITVLNRIEERQAADRKQRDEDRIRRLEEREAILNRDRGDDLGPSNAEIAAIDKAQRGAEKLLLSLEKQNTVLRVNKEEGRGAAEALRTLTINQFALGQAAEDTIEKLREQSELLAISQATAQFDKVLDALMEENRLLALSNTERAVSIALTKAGVEASSERAAAIREEVEAQLDLVEAQSQAVGIEELERELELLQLTKEEREVAIALDRLGIDAGDERAAQIEELITKIRELRDAEEETFSFTETIAEQTSIAIRGLIKDAFTGDLDDIQATFANFLSELGQELLTSLFLQLLADAFGNIGGPIGGVFQQAFGGTGRQFGGFVDAGQPFIGNEGQGGRPEVFIPREAGRISPASEQGGAQPQIFILNEQDPEGLLAVNRTRAGVIEQRNFVTADARKINRVLGRR